MLTRSRARLDLPAITEVWRRGSVIASWLLDLTAQAFDQSPELADFAGRVSDSGEGRWTSIAAIDVSAPAPVLTAALYARFSSRGEADSAAGRFIEEAVATAVCGLDSAQGDARIDMQLEGRARVEVPSVTGVSAAPEGTLPRTGGGFAVVLGGAALAAGLAIRRLLQHR